MMGEGSGFLNVIQTLDLVEKLTEASSPKQTATDLLEFVELKQIDLVTKDYFEARMTTTDAKVDKLNAKITAVKDELNAKITAVKNELNAKITAATNELNAKITAVKDELNAKITGLQLFVGFNTALLMAILIKLFVD